MYNKSLIQQSIEYNAQVYTIKKYIRDLDEHYDVENAVFGYDHAARKLDELVEGYMDIDGVYDTVDEALENLSTVDQCVQITRTENGHIYRLGTYHDQLSACTNETRMDISTLSDVR